MSFLRQKYMPKGGPNGGNGGKGGDVVLYADENISDLRTFHFKNIGKQRMENRVVAATKMEKVAKYVY